MPTLISRVNGTYRRVILSVQRYGYPLLTLVRRDFKARYTPTILGLGWTVLQPLILLSLYTLLFSIIIRVKIHPEDTPGDFVLYLMSGFLPYMAISEGIQRGSTSLTENRSLLDKVIFPAEVLPAVPVVSATVTEIIGLLLLLGLAFFFGVYPSVWLVFLPLLVLVRIMITLGLAWLVSVLRVFFSDIGQFLSLLLIAWMFMTPIFYPVEAIPDYLRWLLKVNPLYHLIAAYRAVMLQAESPWPMMIYLLIWTILTPLFGLWFFRKTVEDVKDFL